MLSFPVSQSKVEDLRRRMQALGVVEGDMKEHFFSPNHGRLRNSKAAVAVLLRHGPSKREVRCDSTSSQILNRFIARRALVREMEKEIAQQEGRAEASDNRPGLADERPEQHMARMFAKNYERDIAQPYPASRHTLLGDSGIPKVMIGILGETNSSKRRDSSSKKG